MERGGAGVGQRVGGGEAGSSREGKEYEKNRRRTRNNIKRQILKLLVVNVHPTDFDETEFI